jgi:hypothetical protein
MGKGLSNSNDTEEDSSEDEMEDNPDFEPEMDASESFHLNKMRTAMEKGKYHKTHFV